MRHLRRLGEIALLAGATALSGCMQMSYVVRLNEDGSGRVTEVVTFGPKIVRLEKKLPEGEGKRLADFLTEARVKERAALMGENVTVADWKVENTKDGGVTLTAVYAFRDINDVSLCMFPLDREWEKWRLRFEHGASHNPKRPWIHLHCIYENLVKTHTPTPHWHPEKKKFKPASELEMEKVRRLLPIFKDMLRSFRLTVKIEVYERKKWASWARGHAICKHANHISVTGGRETLIDVKASDLTSNDDALMILVPWRQLGAEIRLKRMLDLPVQFPYGGRVRYQWLPIQHARSREYY